MRGERAIKFPDTPPTSHVVVEWDRVNQKVAATHYLDFADDDAAAAYARQRSDRKRHLTVFPWARWFKGVRPSARP